MTTPKSSPILVVDNAIIRIERMLAQQVKGLDVKEEPLTPDEFYQLRETLKVLCANRELINQVRDERKGMKIAGLTSQDELEEMILNIKEARSRKPSKDDDEP